MLVCWLYGCLSRDLSHVVGVLGLIITRKIEEQLDCGSDFFGVLALARETWAFSEPAQATCGDLFMLTDAGFSLYSCHSPHYRTLDFWFVGELSPCLGA